MADDSEAIGVFARIKPVSREKASESVKVVKRCGIQKTVQVKNLEFSLDWIFDSESEQELLYEKVARARIATVLQGYNCTLMAYGQTGSGKTHTMFGPDEVLTDFINSDRERGLAPRAIEQIYEEIQHKSADASFIIQCSYIEVCNDSLRDLLSPNGRTVQLRESPSKGFVIEGLSTEVLSGTSDAMATIARGNLRRTVAAMRMNARSSRGHGIFTVYVKEMLPMGGEKNGKLNLIDLAGMESSKKSSAVEGASSNPARREEAKHINTSLYALGTVIEKLSEAAGRSCHVPYRDSKLTRLLRDSLGGNCRSMIVVTLRVEKENIEESIATLRFAQRAKAIKTVVKENTSGLNDRAMLLAVVQDLEGKLEMSSLMVKQLQAEISKRSREEGEQIAQAELAAQQAAEDAANSKLSSGQMEKQFKAQRLELVATRAAKQHLQRQYRMLRTRSTVQHVLQIQSKQLLETLKASHLEALNQLSEQEEILATRDEEAALLHAKVDELERALREATRACATDELIARQQRTDVAAAAPSHDLHIAGAEEELRKAMATRDPAALKRAIALASATVAQVRSRSVQVISSGEVMRGGGLSDSHEAPVQLEASEQERHYTLFHERATARKLSLASRGFEVENVFIADMYDIAEREGVDPSKWGAFLHERLPSPTADADHEHSHMPNCHTATPYEVETEVLLQQAQDGFRENILQRACSDANADPLTWGQVV